MEEDCYAFYTNECSCPNCEMERQHQEHDEDECD